MVSILLFNPDAVYKSGPTWWHNFAETVEGKGKGGVRVDTINTVLMEYAAHFHCTGPGGTRSWGNRYIDFYDERAYNWFVLRWS